MSILNYLKRPIANLATNEVDFRPGANTVVNGIFASSTSWTLGSGWSVALNKATKTTGNTNALSQECLESGSWWIIYFELTLVSGSIRVVAGGGAGSLRTASGIYSEMIYVPTTDVLQFVPSSSFGGSITNVSAALYNVSLSELTKNNLGSLANVYPTYGIKGAQKELVFHKNTDHVKVSSGLGIDTHPCTFACGFRVENKPAEGTSRGIMVMDDLSYSFGIDIYTSSGLLYLRFGHKTVSFVGESVLINLNEDYSLFCVFNGVSSRLVLLNSIAATQIVNADLSGMIYPDPTYDYLSIGKLGLGIQDTVARTAIKRPLVFNYALTGTEISSIINFTSHLSRADLGQNLTTLYESDFSVDEDGFALGIDATNMVLTSAETVAGETNCLKATASDDGGLQLIADCGLDSEKRYRATFRYYTDASSTIYFAAGDSVVELETRGNNIPVVAGSWQTASLEFSPNDQNFRFGLSSSEVLLLTGGIASGNVFAFKDIAITPIGCVLDFSDAHLLPFQIFDWDNHITAEVTGSLVEEFTTAPAIYFKDYSSYVENSNLTITGKTMIVFWIKPILYSASQINVILSNGSVVVGIDHNYNSLVASCSGYTFAYSAANSIRVNEWNFVCVNIHDGGYIDFYIGYIGVEPVHSGSYEQYAGEFNSSNVLVFGNTVTHNTGWSFILERPILCKELAEKNGIVAIWRGYLIGSNVSVENPVVPDEDDQSVLDTVRFVQMSDLHAAPERSLMGLAYLHEQHPIDGVVAPGDFIASSQNGIPYIYPEITNILGPNAHFLASPGNHDIYDNGGARDAMPYLRNEVNNFVANRVNSATSRVICFRERAVWKLRRSAPSVYIDPDTEEVFTWKDLGYVENTWRHMFTSFGWEVSGFSVPTLRHNVYNEGSSARGTFNTTWYFRKKIYVFNAAAVITIATSYKIRGGAIFYINGQELFRTVNLPAEVTDTTNATDATQRTATETIANTGILTDGWNLLSVEVHVPVGTSGTTGFSFEASLEFGVLNDNYNGYFAGYTPLGESIVAMENYEDTSWYADSIVRPTMYVYDKGSVRVIAINPYWDGTETADSDAPITNSGTLGRTIEKIRQFVYRACKSAGGKQIIVICHEPAWPWGPPPWNTTYLGHEGDSLDLWPDDRDHFWSILHRLKVRFFLHGHNHGHIYFAPYVGYQVVISGVVRDTYLLDEDSHTIHVGSGLSGMYVVMDNQLPPGNATSSYGDSRAGLSVYEYINSTGYVKHLRYEYQSLGIWNLENQNLYLFDNRLTAETTEPFTVSDPLDVDAVTWDYMGKTESKTTLSIGNARGISYHHDLNRLLMITNETTPKIYLLNDTAPFAINESWTIVGLTSPPTDICYLGSGVIAVLCTDGRIIIGPLTPSSGTWDVANAYRSVNVLAGQPSTVSNFVGLSFDPVEIPATSGNKIGIGYLWAVHLNWSRRGFKIPLYNDVTLGTVVAFNTLEAPFLGDDISGSIHAVCTSRFSDIHFAPYLRRFFVPDRSAKEMAEVRLNQDGTMTLLDYDPAKDLPVFGNELGFCGKPDATMFYMFGTATEEPVATCELMRIPPAQDLTLPNSPAVVYPTITEPVIEPVIAPVSLTSFSSDTARITGTVSDGDTMTARGVVYSESIDPTVGGEGCSSQAHAEIGNGEYYMDLSLSVDTRYYARLYVYQNELYYYGAQITFKTPEAAPTGWRLTSILNGATHYKYTATLQSDGTPNNQSGITFCTDDGLLYVTSQDSTGVVANGFYVQDVDGKRQGNIVRTASSAYKYSNLTDIEEVHYIGNRYFMYSDEYFFNLYITRIPRSRVNTQNLGLVPPRVLSINGSVNIDHLSSTIVIQLKAADGKVGGITPSNTNSGMEAFCFDPVTQILYFGMQSPANIFWVDLSSVITAYLADPSSRLFNLSGNVECLTMSFENWSTYLTKIGGFHYIARLKRLLIHQNDDQGTYRRVIEYDLPSRKFIQETNLTSISGYFDSGMPEGISSTPDGLKIFSVTDSSGSTKVNTLNAVEIFDGIHEIQDGYDYEYPFPGEDKGAPILSLGVVSDVHLINLSSDVQGPIRYQFLQQAYDYFNRLGVDAVINLGDIYDNNWNTYSYNREYENFIYAISLLDGIDHYTAIGNHDILDPDFCGPNFMTTTFLNFYNYSGQTTLLTEAERTKGYFSKEIKSGVQGIFLCPFYESDDTLNYANRLDGFTQPYQLGPTQRAWLLSEIQTAHGVAKKIIIFCHVPIYPGTELGDAATIRGWLESYKYSVEAGYGVIAVLSGHGHYYNKSVSNGIQYYIVDDTYNAVYIPFQGNILSYLPAYTFDLFADGSSQLVPVAGGPTQTDYKHSAKIIVSSFTVLTSTITVNIKLLYEGTDHVNRIGVCWALTSNPDIEDNVIYLQDVTEGTVQIVDPDPGNVIYFRAFAETADYVIYSRIWIEESYVSTGIIVRSDAATNIAYNSFTANGTLLDPGAGSVVLLGIAWGLEENPDTDDNVVQHTDQETGEFACAITGLEALQTYYYRAVAHNGSQAFYGDNVQVKTAQCLSPEINDNTSYIERFASSNNLINTSLRVFSKNSNETIDGVLLGRTAGGAESQDEPIQALAYDDEAGILYISRRRNLGSWNAISSGSIWHNCQAGSLYAVEIIQSPTWDVDLLRTFIIERPFSLNTDGTLRTEIFVSDISGLAVNPATKKVYTLNERDSSVMQYDLSGLTEGLTFNPHTAQSGVRTADDKVNSEGELRVKLFRGGPTFTGSGSGTDEEGMAFDYTHRRSLFLLDQYEGTGTSILLREFNPDAWNNARNNPTRSWDLMLINATINGVTATISTHLKGSQARGYDLHYDPESDHIFVAMCQHKTVSPSVGGRGYIFEFKFVVSGSNVSLVCVGVLDFGSTVEDGQTPRAITLSQDKTLLFAGVTGGVTVLLPSTTIRFAIFQV